MTTDGYRHCGRCQREFDADPALYFQTDWALCPECQDILLPRRTYGARPVEPDGAGQ